MKIDLFKTMWTRLFVQIIYVVGSLAAVAVPIYLVATGRSAWYLMLIPAIFIIIRLFCEWLIVLFNIHDYLQKMSNSSQL